MLSKLFMRQMKEQIQRAYDAGLNKGYELGYMMGKADRTNRGFIIAPYNKQEKVKQEIEEILQNKGE